MSLFDGGGGGGGGHHELGQLPNNMGQAQMPNNTGGDAGRRSVRIADNSVRKYLLLLHDCLAIKFVPIGPRVSPTDAQPFGTSSARSSGFGQGQRPPRPSSVTSNRTMTQFPGAAFGESAVPEVDNSLHGLCLFKGFRDANLQCYWNSALYEAFRNLEYKGYILPSTVLIWAIPRFLTTLRTAWARQMLRSPPGYRIEFIGEIEELIADPVQQSQFAPLSDSLCWAILEITSLGQEAFVDSILGALSAAFPTMVEPGRELVYQTLEKLIKERKVYQTAHGYFVVTPDTFRYMSSSNDHHPHYATLQPPQSTMDMTLDALMTSPIPPTANANTDSEEKVCFSRNSWDSTASAGSPVREKEFGSEVKPSIEQPPLRRHNSLKIIRQKDKENIQSGSKTLGRRTLSFRLYKSKSTPNTGVSGKDKGTSPDDESEFPTTSEPKVKSGKSFFRKLFKRSSSKGKKATATVESPPPTPSTPPAKISASTSTQTPTTPVDPIPRITETRVMDDEIYPASGGQCGLSQLGYSTELLTSRWDSLPKPERPRSRMADDGPHYATPSNPAPTTPSRPNSMFNFQRGESSRCSTLSQGTSLGYGSQGPASLGFHSQSPTPSLSPSGTYAKSKSSNAPPVVPNLLPRNSANYNSYRSYYDFYRRRYPSYGSSTGQPQSRTPTPVVTSTRPNSHCYETINNYPRPKTLEPNKLPRESKSENKNTITIAQSPNKDPFTTTVTQNVKSTTNMELQFRLPLGKLSQGNPVTNGTTNKFTLRGSEPTTTRVNVNVGGGDKVPSGATTNKSTTNGNTTRISVDQCQPKTAVKTTVNHNGIIETHFDCSDDKSSVEIELSGNNRGTNVFLVNSKSGERQLVNNTGGQNEPKAYRKISDIGLYRNGNGYPPVRVTDICKDSDEEFM